MFNLIFLIIFIIIILGVFIHPKHFWLSRFFGLIESGFGSFLTFVIIRILTDLLSRMNEGDICENKLSLQPFVDFTYAFVVDSTAIVFLLGFFLVVLLWEIFLFIWNLILIYQHLFRK